MSIMQQLNPETSPDGITYTNVNSQETLRIKVI